MIRKILITIAAAGASLTAFGQQKYIADKVVAVVGSEPVLYSDVVERSEQLVEQYRQQGFTSDRDPMAEALEVLLEQKLLYQRAVIDSIGIEMLAPQIEQAADESVEDMVAEAGSIKALEAEKNKPVYAIKEDVVADLTEYYGASHMHGNITGQVKVTPGEVDRFFRRIDSDSLPVIPQQYVYAQITRLPESEEIAKQRTRERLLDLRQRIIDGERFDRLAFAYSLDGGSASRGGEYDPSPKEMWHPPFAEALTKLQPGQISGVVETESGFHIIQLLDKPGDNLYHFRHILLKPSYTIEEQAEMIDFLDSLAGVIRKGDVTFEQAAFTHSADAATRKNGGLVTNQQMLFQQTGESNPGMTRTRFIVDNLNPTDSPYLIRMKEGDISQAFMGRDLRMDEMGKILKLVEIVPVHKANLSDDYLDIEQMALERKQEDHYKKWLDSKIDEIYVRIDPMFSTDDFENKHWFK